METKAAPGPSGLENLNKWDPSAQQAFIQPATHNKNSVRVAAILIASALAAKGSLLVPGNLAKVIHSTATSRNSSPYRFRFTQRFIRGMYRYISYCAVRRIFSLNIPVPVDLHLTTASQYVPTAVPLGRETP